MPANSEFPDVLEDTDNTSAGQSSPQGEGDEISGGVEVVEVAVEALSVPEPSTATPEIAEADTVPVNWEERCAQMEHKLKQLTETTRLRKRLIEIRETESKNLRSRLSILSDSIQEEKKARAELMDRVEATEMECQTVKDKLRRNLESLERVKGHHERRVAMLTANIEIADIKAQGTTRKLDEAHRKNAELKGLLEELNMKLNENKKVAKGLEKKLKKANDKNKFLTSQVAQISDILVEVDVVGADAATLAVVGGEEGYLKLKKILKQSEEVNMTKVLPVGDSGDDKTDEDEGVELYSLLDLDEDSEDLQKEIPGEESCYKQVITSNGPELILSVSKTFIKLKDLILEKRSLQQAIDNFKGLNTKLESKVDKQERRLYCVTKEINKTWSLVSKLKLQQDKLLNSEAFLRYELKENRAIVQKLKKEMQSYKEKWKNVRERNEESQAVWQELKDEFAQRRLTGRYVSSLRKDTDEVAVDDEMSTSTPESTPTSPASPQVEENVTEALSKQEIVTEVTPASETVPEVMPMPTPPPDASQSSP